MDQIPIIASSTDHKSRKSILQIAADRAKAHYQTEQFESITYLGDAVWDYKTTSELGWAFIGIGSKIDQLRRLGATALFTDYSDAGALLQEI